MKKILSMMVLFSIIFQFFFPFLASPLTSGSTTPWTMEKAEHLAGRTLIGATPQMIEKLYQAGSAENAVNILFPSIAWPDRTEFHQNLEAFKWPEFNVSDTNANRKAYAFTYYADPYEAKRKLFWLFEDIFPVDRDGAGATNINFPDIENHFKILYEESLGNYKKMVKRVLFDTQNSENSFAMGKYLDLLNQPNKDRPNENYARELMQLFLMLEHKPWEDAETPNAVRNYTEEDVASLALLLTGFKYGADKKVYFDPASHNTNTGVVFLSGSLKSWDSFPFYNTGSGTIDNTQIIQPISWNNGLADNVIDYIFSKREFEIASFLSWRLLKYYVHDKPTQLEIETLANQIINNNFELYPTVKWLLWSDMMYTDTLLTELRYKNPIELTIGTLKILHAKDETFVVDPLLNDTSLLVHLDWVPYNPRSIFGRDGFDNNTGFMNAYFHNQWVNYASKIAFTSGTGTYNLSQLIPQTYHTNTGTFAIKTHTGNTYSGSISLGAFSLSTLVETLSWTQTQNFQIQKTLFLEDPLLDETSLTWEVISSGNTLPDEESLSLTGTQNNSSLSGSWETTSIWTGALQDEPSSSTSQEEILSSSGAQTSSGETQEITASGSISSDEKTQLIPETPEEEKTQEVSEKETPPETLPEGDNTSISEVSFYEKIFPPIFPKVHAGEAESEILSFATGSIVFPDFFIQTASGKIYLEGNFDANNGSLTLSSGTLLSGWKTYHFSPKTLLAEPGFQFHYDINETEMFDQLEQNLYVWRKIPHIIREKLTTFLSTNDAGNARKFLPNNSTYRNKYIKATLAILLAQPEFLLLSGYKKDPIIWGWSGSSQITDTTKKLIMIELYGGYDWINGVIPKNEYDYYSQIRGPLAYKKEDLIDIGDFYLNKTFENFKPFYDAGELRIVNRVGTPNHSRWHDTAAIQVASQKALQTIATPGLIGELIKNDTNPLNHIVLGTNRPPIYTNGNYINIGWNSILYNNPVWWMTSSEKQYQLSVLKNILNTRDYPGNTQHNFKNSVTLDTVGSNGQSSVWYTLATRLNFTKNLIENGLGVTYYVPGGWWYDTHGDQLKQWAYNLWDRTRDLAKDIGDFFTQMKNSGKDVTIVVYSEFWRTLKANGTSGTDHGQWWGYFILSTNNTLKNNLPQKVIGKISLEKEYNDWLWVGVDYRTIYSEILKSLYQVDVAKYFGKVFSLSDDINTQVPKPVLFRNEYKETWWGNVWVQMKFKIDDSNFRFKDGSYLKLKYGTDPAKMTQFSKWTMDNYVYEEKTDSFHIPLTLSKGKMYYYELEIVDNQYDSYTLSWNFLVPDKYEANSTIHTIPLTTDSFFAKYNNTIVSGEKKIDKLTLFNNPLQEITLTGSTLTGTTQSGTTLTGVTSTGTITVLTGSLKDVSFTWGIVMTFGTGETFIDTLTHSWVWNGWFIIPKFISKNEFISDSMSWSGMLLKNLNIENILKVGADSLWVGMQLSQKVWIQLPILDGAGEYKVIKSEDGFLWQEIPVVKKQNNISFSTTDFTYFALFDNKKIIIPPPSSSSSSGGGSSSSSSSSSSSWGSSSSSSSSSSGGWSSSSSSSSGGGSSSSSGWWWGGGSPLLKDDCPTWDYSPSYYDKTCGQVQSNISQWSNTQPVIKDKNYYKNLKQQILENRKKLKEQNNGKILSTQVGNYTISEISWYQLSDKIKKISLWIATHKKLSQDEKKRYIERLNTFLLAKYHYESQRGSQEMKNKYKKEMILLKSVFQKLKKL